MIHASFPAFALSFLAGTSAVLLLPALPSTGLIPAVIFSALLWVKFPAFRVIATFVFGLAWAAFRADLILMESLPPELENEVVNITAEIIDVPEQFTHKTQILVRARDISFNGQHWPMPGRIRLALYRTNLSFQAGEIWQFSAKLKSPHGFSNPGTFDYEKFLFQKHIRATGYVKQPETAHKLKTGDEHFFINRVRQSLAENIHNQLSEKASSGLIAALATGVRTNITPSQWDIMRSTGTNHLMAISGLHVGLIAGVVYWLCVRLWCFIPRFVLWLPAQKAAVVPAILSAILYAALAGFSIPVQRALIMLVIAMLVMALNRRVTPPYVISFALMGVLIFDPVSVMSAGFWLSFAAVAIIAWAFAGHPRQNKIRQALYIQLAVSLGLIPVLLLFFGQFSLVSPVANLLAVPVVGLLVTPVVLIGVIAKAFGFSGLSGLLWTAAEQVVSWLWHWLSFISTNVPFSSIHFSPVVWTLPVAAIGALILLAPRGLPGKWLGVLWLLPMFLIRPEAPDSGEIRMTLLDVGQGLAIVVQTQENTLVYDAGRRFSDRFDSGADIVAPYLYSLGVDHIDQLIISHEDSDHRGGEPGLRKKVPVLAAYSSVPDLVNGASDCFAGQVWHDGTVEFRMLHPDENSDENENDKSCVLRISGPYGSLLLPGDIEKNAELTVLTRYRNELESDVLVVPHHGSATSSSPAFIDAVRPRLALYSAGLKNRFHHPGPGVVRRYQERNIDTLNTAYSGAITIALQKEGLRVKQHRVAHKHFWQAAFPQTTELLHSSAN